MGESKVKAQQAYQMYQQTRVQTANPGNLILLLYQEGIKRLYQAEQAVDKGDIEGANNDLTTAQDIIVELMCSLRDPDGGGFVENMRRLYDYMHHRLVQANLKKDAAVIREVRDMLETLLEAWREILQPSQTENEKDPAPLNHRA